jgi:phosphohistidine swiveling domain-containing protein
MTQQAPAIVQTSRALGTDRFDGPRAGHKAANLHELLQEGFAVPPGFVVFHDESVADIADDELAASVESLGGWPVAVRSSGCLEDLPDASFAGQYESYLNVKTIAELRQAIEQCRASGLAERVRVYLRQAGLSPSAAAVSVLVQQMVPATMAGVGFSLAPDTGREEHGLVECCAGLGEALVSGHVNPSRYVLALDHGTIVDHERGSDGIELTAEQAQQVAALLLDVQAHFGQPQDIEWAFDGQGRLKVLQSRPITTISWRADVEELSNADFKDGGISAQVCTPLMFSLYRNATEKSFQDYFVNIRLISRTAPPEQWIFYHYGRGYWNASAVKRALAKVPGFDEKKFDEDLGIQKDYGPQGPLRVDQNLRTVVPAIPVALALEKSYRGQLAYVRESKAEFEKQLSLYRNKIEQFSSTEDKDFYRDLDLVFHQFHTWVEQTYFTTIYNNSNAQTDFKSFLTKLNDATGLETSLVELLGGLTNVSHMEMQRGIVSLYRAAQHHGLDSEVWQQELSTFLEANYFHSDKELDLTVPRWGERPERIAEMIQDMLHSATEPLDPTLSSQRQAELLQAAVARVEQALNQKMWLHLRYGRAFRSHLKRVRTYLSAREEMRERSMKCYDAVRQYALEAGRRLAATGLLEQVDDLFMVSTQELVALALGEAPAELTQQIAYRRKMYAGYRNLTPPNEFGVGVEQRSAATYVQEQDGTTVLQGLGCSPGCVEGPVRILCSQEEIGRIQGGDILVTKFTDPGWTPVLGLVAGVVTEVGGMLSHAAVIGREYGIPAVLNLPGATQVLREGQRIRVDGRQGTVAILSTADDLAARAEEADTPSSRRVAV